MIQTLNADILATTERMNRSRLLWKLWLFLEGALQRFKKTGLKGIVGEWDLKWCLLGRDSGLLREGWKGTLCRASQRGSRFLAERLLGLSEGCENICQVAGSFEAEVAAVGDRESLG